jgi:uncharacterized membrane protein
VNDIRKAPLVSLGYGFVMAFMIMFVAVMAWNYGSAWLMLSLLSVFVFAAPLACIGTYAISAQIERNQPVSLKRTLRASFKRYIGTELVFTLVLLVVFLLWARASSVVSIFLPSDPEHQLSDMVGYLASLSVISFVFMSITFAASVFSLPMIMHRDVDAITAVVTSVNAVLRNKTAMMVWAIIIALVVVVGVLTAGVALIFLLPAVGHAVWHGYLETIIVDDFPRHELGVTANPRSK